MTSKRPQYDYGRAQLRPQLLQQLKDRLSSIPFPTRVSSAADFLMRSVERLHQLLADLCSLCWHTIRQAAISERDYGLSFPAWTALSSLNAEISARLRSTVQADEIARDLVDHPLVQCVGEELPDRVHAEMRLLDYYLRSPARRSLSLPLSLPYIGVSKLCCVHCYYILRHVCVDVKAVVPGKHGVAYSWQLPWLHPKNERILNALQVGDEMRRCWNLVLDIDNSKGATIPVTVEGDYHGTSRVRCIDFALDVFQYGFQPMPAMPGVTSVRDSLRLEEQLQFCDSRNANVSAPLPRSLDKHLTRLLNMFARPH